MRRGMRYGRKVANLTPKRKRAMMPELIATHRGNVSAVARALNMPRSSVHVIIQADPALKQLLDDERERMLDNAEDRLGMAVDKGEAWAVCFTLKTQGQQRGYIERQRVEHSGPNDGPIQTQVIIQGVPGNDDPATHS